MGNVPLFPDAATFAKRGLASRVRLEKACDRICRMYILVRVDGANRVLGNDRSQSQEKYNSGNLFVSLRSSTAGEICRSDISFIAEITKARTGNRF
jgi:hypothetical protein